MTRRILLEQLKCVKNLPTHSLIREIIQMLNLYSVDINLEELIRIINLKQTLFDDEGKEGFDSDVALALRYLLERRTVWNQEAIKLILNSKNNETSISKKRFKRSRQKNGVPNGRSLITG